MGKRSPKPPTVRSNDWGATDHLYGGRRFLTSAQLAQMRRKLADVDAKLRQMTAAERQRWR
jgi:hypothetical protein